jgi:hypothetical protein
MNRIILVFFAIFISINFSAQKEIVLRINHALNGSPFKYNENFNISGNTNYFTRLQYYLSGIVINHDGSQSTSLSNVYVLASGHITNYPLGNFSLNQIESISFNVGVDQIANSGNTLNYPSQHPLGPQSPPMDWGWPSGYFFVVSDGYTDSNSDGNPNAPFSLQALGNQMLTPIDPIIVTPTVSNDTIYIDLIANADKFLSGLDLDVIGIDHSSSPNNLAMCNNAINMNIFEAGNLSLLIKENPNNNFVHIDYTLAFAPTFNYRFHSSSNVTIDVYNIDGKHILHQPNLSHEGSYFPLIEFNSGIYILSLNNGKEKISKKFTITQ